LRIGIIAKKIFGVEMGDDEEFKKNVADRERERFLEKLRDQKIRREQTKDLRKKAVEERTQHASRTSEAYRNRIARRSEFRAQVKRTWMEAHKFREEALRLLGQQYREKLVYVVGRTLEPRKIGPMPTAKPIDLSDTSFTGIEADD
jgi:hypothetical protein